MADTWINHGVYQILEHVGTFSVHFAKVCTYLAAICFLMTLMMAVIKIFLGVSDAREQIIKMGVSICMYFIMMFIYPLAMKSVLPFAMNLGYGAIFGTSSAINIDDNYSELANHNGSRANFYKWMGENTGDIFTTSKDVNQAGNDVSVYLNMNLVDAQTGYIDLNKYVLYIIAFLKIGFHALPKVSIFNADLNLLLCCFLYFLAVIVAVVCMFVVVVNYIMCLLDYFALMGFGVLMIPLSLWDGTKSYTEKLYGSIGSIIIKLLVISAFMCLACMEIINFFIEVYIAFLDVGLYFTPAQSFKLVELSVTLVLKGFVIAVLTMQTEKIANFLNGQSPSMSFKEALAPAAQTAAMAMGAAKLSSSVVNARSAIGNTALRSGMAGITAKSMGASGRDALSSMAATAGNSIGRSAVNGIANAPRALGGAIRSFKNMAGITSGGDSDFPMFLGGSGGSSGGGSGGGSGESSSGNSLKSSGNSSYVPDNVNNDLRGDKANSEEIGNNSYGISSVNSQGDYSSLGDKMMAGASDMQNGSLAERKIGNYTGIAGSVMKEMGDARRERDSGNVMGNSKAQAFARGIGRGVYGKFTSELNKGGGMQLRFNHSEQLKQKFGSKATVKVNNIDKRDINSEGQITRRPIDVHEN